MHFSCWNLPSKWAIFNSPFLSFSFNLLQAQWLLVLVFSVVFSGKASLDFWLESIVNKFFYKLYSAHIQCQNVTNLCSQLVWLCCSIGMQHEGKTGELWAKLLPVGWVLIYFQCKYFLLPPIFPISAKNVIVYNFNFYQHRQDYQANPQLKDL